MKPRNMKHQKPEWNAFVHVAVSMQSEAPLISESVTVNTRFQLQVPDSAIVSRCEASRCRPSRRLRATKSKPRHVHSFTPGHVSVSAPLFHTPTSQSHRLSSSLRVCILQSMMLNI